MISKKTYTGTTYVPLNKSFISLFMFSMFSCVLFYYNKPKKKTFVGDTFCYFAGSLIAWCGIIGNYPIKLMFFFLPQLFNFLLSLPQLFGFVHCPRHRLPLRDKKTNKVFMKYKESNMQLHGTYPTNLNNINFFLWLFGPMDEEDLGDLCLSIQSMSSVITFITLRLIGFQSMNKNFSNK